MKKISLFVAIISLTVVSAFSASFVAPTAASAAYVGCTDLRSDLYVGQTDSMTAGQVGALQAFLISANYLGIYAPTGQFGSRTKQAVTTYQYNHGMYASGYVDAATRASIYSESCTGNVYNGYNSGYQNTYYGSTNYYNGYNNYNNNYSYNNYYTVPSISSLSVNSGPVGTQVTIYGLGFDYTNNSVNFNGQRITGLTSYNNGTSLSFTVPQITNNIYYGNNTTGVYALSVTTSHGTSNSLNFTVTSNYPNVCYQNGYYNNYCNNTNSTVTISNLNGPTSITAGTSGTWSVSLYNPNTNFVSVTARWGDEGTYAYNTSAQSSQLSAVQGQQTVSFSHTYQASGTYTIIFTATNSSGLVTTVTTTVNVVGSTSYYGGQNQISLLSVSPTTARAGSQVILYGAGFTPYGNTVHFGGTGGTANLSSSNGYIYFTIPYSIGACDVVSTPGTYCPMYAQQVLPGSYSMYVTNSYGQVSNAINFIVSQY